jgi:protein involved in ribonucleotide reduction
VSINVILLIITGIRKSGSGRFFIHFGALSNKIKRQINVPCIYHFQMTVENNQAKKGGKICGEQI